MKSINFSQYEGILEKYGESTNIWICLKPAAENLNHRKIEISIIVEDDQGQSEIVFLSIHVNPIDAKLECFPKQLIVPPLPVGKNHEFDFNLTVHNSEADFQLTNVGFICWKKLESQDIPVLLNLPEGTGKFNRSKNLTTKLPA